MRHRRFNAGRAMLAAAIATLGLAGASTAQAQSDQTNEADNASQQDQPLKIEYTRFYPDRMVDGDHTDKWGPRWSWPLKTFPDGWRMNWMSDLGDSYGLIYWPGETVKVRLEGGGGKAAIDRVTATNVVDDSTLSVNPRTGSKKMTALSDSKNVFQTASLDKAGIRCEIYKTDDVAPPEDGQRVGQKIVKKINLDPAPSEQQFALRFIWYGKIARQGEYDFRLESDDGSHLLIDGKQVVNNGGNHGMETAKSSATLDVGVHKFELRYWQGHGGKGLEFASNVPADGSAGRKWEIPIPESEKEKHLELYRVKAFRDGKEVTSRGLIVADPWSGMTAHGDPKGLIASKGKTFHEWSGGIVSPPTHMTFFFGSNRPFSNEVFPMRDRPWGQVTEYGLAELYDSSWPRTKHWEKLNNGKKIKVGGDQEKAFTSNGYKDPTLEWNPWWVYYAPGVSKWHGEWQWGPFSDMSIESFHPGNGSKMHRYEICYGDTKKYSAAYPNGLLYWQWYWNGLLRLHEQLTQYQRGDVTQPVSFTASDGWAANSLMFAMRRWIRYHQEVGMMRLFYRRNKLKNESNAWTKKYPSFGDFMWKQVDKTLAGDKTNDLTLMFGRKDLDTRGWALMSRAMRQSYENVTGKESTSFSGHFSALDFGPSDQLFRNFRPMNEVFFNKTMTWMDTGGDYGHYAVGNGNDYFHDLREYRGYGLIGALTGALFPETRYGYGYNVVNFEEDNPKGGNNGANMPGNKAWAERTIKYRYDRHHSLSFQKRVKFMDDGQSYRRFDLAERIPMYLDETGEFRGRGVANQGPWGPSRIEKWNTQVFLGAQAVEIPDRKRPLTGVMVIDSNNPEARENGNQFLTADHEFNGYIVSMMDELGIWAFTNPTMLDQVPEDMPRIYLPRKLDGEPVLMAKVNGQTITVPYTGEEMHKPSHAGFKKFVQKIRDAHQGQWPVQTTGGFVATAWQSSNGDYFVYVENPMSPKDKDSLDQPPKQYDDKPLLKELIKERPGRAHPHREGTIRVRLQEPMGEPIVIDMNGDNPDPHRLADDKVNAEGDTISFDLEWDRGDGRLFWIPAATAQNSRQARAE
jgi:hypothetical protein